MRRLPQPNIFLAGAALFVGLALSSCGDVESAPSEEAAAESSATQDASEEGAAKQDSAPEEIAFGERIELVDHLVEGEITVFDFTSPYCPPCRQISPWLDRLHRERDDLSVVKVNINRPEKRGIDWGSPVARQYGMQSIPAFIVYDAEGQIMAQGEQGKGVVIGWLQELAPAEGR